METSRKREGHSVPRALKAVARLGKEPHGQLQGPGRGGGWHKGRVREWRTHRLDRSAPAEATLHSDRLQDRSRQKWSKLDPRGEWEDLREEGWDRLDSVQCSSH